jgi:hypothetical protein
MLQVFEEAERLAAMRHPCVIAFYGIVTAPESYGTVVEYLCNGSLSSCLRRIAKTQVSGCARSSSEHEPA